VSLVGNRVSDLGLIVGLAAEPNQVLPQPDANERRPTVHFQRWRISCCNKFDFDTLGMEAMTQMELLIQKNIIFVTTQTSNYVMHS